MVKALESQTTDCSSLNICGGGDDGVVAENRKMVFNIKV
jgi:hypothetical protein